MINGITHRGNRHTRPLLRVDELPTGVHEREFEYVDADEYSARFFNYRGAWYDAHEFEVAPHSVKALGYDGVQTESYFSAVVISYFDRDGYELEDEIIVGYIHW